MRAGLFIAHEAISRLNRFNSFRIPPNMDYFWQQPHWPNFTWQSDKLLTPLAAVRRKQGDLLRLVQTLGFEDQLTAFAQHLADDVKNTAEIEGEHPDIESIRSSVARHLGLSTAGLKLPSHAIDNQVEILLDATHHAEEPLTKDRLFAWHRALFPNGSSGLYAIRVGDWRNDVMRGVSGGFGHETVHFEAPPPERIPEEIQHFLAWWNDRSHLLDGLLRAGIAHLYFVTIHPFDDGNGRITRALTDMALAQDDHFNQRYYSLSKTIMANRSAYYEVLETTQRGNGDCTPWLLWFIRTIDSALTEAKQCLQETLFKADYWRIYRKVPLSERQRKVINRLFDAGKGGFTGGLNTRKYQSLTGVSRATAWRETADLLSVGMLRLISGARGRSTSYELPWPDDLPSRAVD